MLVITEGLGRSKCKVPLEKCFKPRFQKTLIKNVSGNMNSKGKE
jgi:hypothetical protein